MWYVLRWKIKPWIAINVHYTAWKVSKYGVFLVRIFPHMDWIRENTDQKNSVFKYFLRSVADKVIKSIGILRKLQMILPRRLWVTIYKFFIRPHLDYGDIIFEKAYSKTFHDNLESNQFNILLAITGAISGTLREKLYQELGLESLQHGRWFRVISTSYFLRLQTSSCIARWFINKPSFHFKHVFLKNSFFPSANNKWSNLDIFIHNSKYLSNF